MLCFFSAVAVRFFHLLNKRNSCSIPQRSRIMSCRPNPSPDSAKVWLLPLPIELSLHIPGITFHARFIHFFHLRFAFLFLPVYFSPIHNTTVLSTIHNLLMRVLFRLSISSMQCTNTYKCLHICLRAKPVPTKPTIFIAYVSNTCSTSTSWYRPLPHPYS